MAYMVLFNLVLYVKEILNNEILFLYSLVRRRKIDRRNVLVLDHGCLHSWLLPNVPGASDRALARESLWRIDLCPPDTTCCTAEELVLSVGKKGFSALSCRVLTVARGRRYCC